MELAQGQRPRAALGRAAVLTDRAAQRALLSIGVTAFFIAGYFGVGYAIDPAKASDLGTSLDRRIPFIPSTVWIYLWVFPASLLPLFLVRCPRLFRRALLSYAIAIAASLVVFAAYPVTSIGLRAGAALDLTRFSSWAVALLYRVDPPVNLFPSLHLSIAALAALAAFKARPAYGCVAGIGVALIAVSICTVKQHFVLDAVGGGALAALVHAAVLRSYRPDPGTDPAFGSRGPLAFAALLAAVYAGFYAGFVLTT